MALINTDDSGRRKGGNRIMNIEKSSSHHGGWNVLRRHHGKSAVDSGSSGLAPISALTQTPSPITVVIPAKQPISRNSTAEEDDEYEIASFATSISEAKATTAATSAITGSIASSMATFPDSAPIGSHHNCWARPQASDFVVRGPHYLVDQKKVPSAAAYLFPCRGVDLFLTNDVPMNVAHTHPGLLNGRLRDVPTLIINFRLPWGILLMYCEIPAKFVPFLNAGAAAAASSSHSTTTTREAELDPLLDQLSPSERAAARWLSSRTDADKNRALKIVPVVVDGPWVVKSVVSGKPALIGAKVPIAYSYSEPPSDNSSKSHLAPYIEADLDIAASTAARSILSIARSYTHVLTLNLGFVIQGNAADELPEQMLTGVRLHGIDPSTAPTFPNSSVVHADSAADLTVDSSSDGGFP